MAKKKNPKISYYKNQDHGACYETVSPRNVRSYTHKVSLSLPKHVQNKVTHNREAKVDRQEPQKASNLHKELQRAQE